MIMQVKRVVAMGQLVMTRGALDALDKKSVVKAIQRHRQGDWGELDPEDSKLNDQCLQEGGRLLSAYHDANDTKFWIITEADRSSTCVLLPEEY